MEACLKLLELGYYELKFAFVGLADENVWKRPAPALLSVGEQAGHIVFGEATRLAADEVNPEQCRIQSPLIDRRFRYYPATLETSPSEQHLAMTAEQVYAEVVRVHQEAVAHFRALNPDPATRIPGCPTGFTYGEFLEYAAFHIAYHTGQIYSARHLLGEETEDN